MRSLRFANRALGVLVLIVQLMFIAAVSSLAYGQSSQQVYNSLAKSRDALLDQRKYLQSEADRLSQQVQLLQQKLDRVNAYMRDNDRALRDVETAMRQAQ
ncbi:MAG TPA: hypothetical protein PKN86_20950 [Candidatus Obscuribacter sp.]|nr:hypothetical protein [Candidatus Melainabacteria bacterium]MBK8222205.1 hypothetical protein [Candidatus Obscuribacter sp.]MBK9282240.1 hypothetical protein [Candidatus Obscuribacter sp.]MBL8085808.1 hypothetical protein [Candidatus Obscuribacter sp.]MDX1986789.1 hypothetical protein [Candidatus Obscuribacter sp.]